MYMFNEAPIAPLMIPSSRYSLLVYGILCVVWAIQQFALSLATRYDQPYPLPPAPYTLHPEP